VRRDAGAGPTANGDPNLVFNFHVHAHGVGAGERTDRARQADRRVTRNVGGVRGGVHALQRPWRRRVRPCCFAQRVHDSPSRLSLNGVRRTTDAPRITRPLTPSQRLTCRRLPPVHPPGDQPLGDVRRRSAVLGILLETQTSTAVGLESFRAARRSTAGCVPMPSRWPRLCRVAGGALPTVQVRENRRLRAGKRENQ